MTDLSSCRDIAELKTRYERRETTVTEVVRACLARIESMDRVGPCMRAMVTLNTRALDDAKRLDERFDAGEMPGLLFGVPVVIKDNIDVEGLPTTGGCAALAGLIASADAPVVARLRAAGAVLLGKSNMSEFAFGTYDTQSSVVEGFTRNALVPGFASGGSSGGTAVAIAAGYCLAGLGTDTGCSVRAPAAVNGLAGIRPTHASVAEQPIDMAGIMPMNAEWDTVGPLARNVTDLALILDVMTGIEPGEAPDSAFAAVSSPEQPRLRVGVVRHLVDPADTHAEVGRLFDRCVADMREAGIDVTDPLEAGIFSIPFDARLWYMRFRSDLDGYLARLADRAPHPTLAAVLASGKVQPRYVDNLQSLLEWPHGPDSNPHREEMDRVRDRYRAVFEDLLTRLELDALVFPTFRYPPVENGAMAWTQAGERAPVGSNNYYASLTGFPALSVPMGRTAAGLAVGVQLLGRPNSEKRLLQLARAYEKHSPPSGVTSSGEAAHEQASAELVDTIDALVAVELERAREETLNPPRKSLFGVPPGLLADGGLADALRSLVTRTDRVAQTARRRYVLEMPWGDSIRGLHASRALHEAMREAGDAPQATVLVQAVSAPVRSLPERLLLWKALGESDLDQALLGLLGELSAAGHGAQAGALIRELETTLSTARFDGRRFDEERVARAALQVDTSHWSIFTRGHYASVLGTHLPGAQVERFAGPLARGVTAVGQLWDTLQIDHTGCVVPVGIVGVMAALAIPAGRGATSLAFMGVWMLWLLATMRTHFGRESRPSFKFVAVLVYLGLLGAALVSAVAGI